MTTNTKKSNLPPIDAQSERIDTSAEIPTPSLDDPELLKACADDTAQAGTQESAEQQGFDVPVCIDVAIIKKTLSVLEQSIPAMALQNEGQRELLAEAWQKPIDQLYQRLLAWLNTDPAKAGPWAQALTVTLAIYGPTIGLAMWNRFTKKQKKQEPKTDAPTGQPQ